MIKLIIIVWFVLVSTLAVSAPHPGKKAFAFNSCNVCHSSLAISPAQITAKYQGQQGAYGYLLNGFRKGSFDVGKVSHGAIDISDKHLENIMEWLVGNRDTSTYASNTKTPVEIEREEKAIKKERQEARLREFDRKHEERMAAINSQQNQAAAQASSQTSQNNYPSDNTNEQNGSNSSSSSSASRGGTGNDAKSCVQVFHTEKGYPMFRNVCNFNITVKYCVVDHDCRGYPGFSRTSNLSPGSKTNAYADPHQDVRYGACEAGQYLDDSANDGNYVCKIR